MSDFKQKYALWDEFLRVWPIDRLASMTLDEYTQAGSKDSFTYWIESRLDELGSIWGGSSFKFGVFSRNNTDDKISDAKLSYSDTHGWYSSLGASAEEAFTQVREFVVQVASLATKGNLDDIENFEHLGEAYKWKIAFHYQNRNTPIIVDVFKKAPLSVYVGDAARGSMAVLQKAALDKRPGNLGILEFGQQIWSEWGKKNLAICKLSHGNPPSFTNEERKVYLDNQLAVMHRDTAKDQGDRFIKAPIGMLFFLCHGNSLQRIGQFTTEASPCAKGDGWLQRSYRVLKQSIRTDRYVANSKYWSPQGNSTFWQVGADDLPEFEQTLLVPYFATSLAVLAGLVGDLAETASLEPFFAEDSVEMINSIAPINRIYYGPPGTGKTYAVQQLLLKGYTQSADTLSPLEWEEQTIGEHIAPLTWWEALAAALYELGGEAKVEQLVSHKYIKAVSGYKGRSNSVRPTIWGALQHHTVTDSKTVNVEQRSSPYIFDKTTDSVWKFAGDWKDECIDLFAIVDRLKKGDFDQTQPIKRYSFVTFHQSYGYEEFVEGLRPLLLDDPTKNIGYEIKKGAFFQLCIDARNDPGHRYAMVIDEINRGNISKIFGELITLIEPDKREGSEHAFPVMLPYSQKPFLVPANVDIIGTMNTADRSLALLDTALRRRFEFVPVMPDTRAIKDPADPESAPLAGLKINFDGKSIDVPLMLQRMNERIEALYDRDHTIGHAYFTFLRGMNDGVERFDGLVNIFRNRIIPLLEEYFFEDWQKIRLVLADNQKGEGVCFINVSDDQKGDLDDLFGSNHDLEVYSTKPRYNLEDGAFKRPDSYIGIYSSLGS